MKPASEFVSEVADILTGRGKSHGSKVENMQRIADMWNAYIAGTDGPLTATDVPHLMSLAKMARYQTGDPTHEDHFLDQIGYAAIAGECALAGSSDKNVAEQNVVVATPPWPLSDRNQPWLAIKDNGPKPSRLVDLLDVEPDSYEAPLRVYRCVFRDRPKDKDWLYWRHAA